MERRVMLAIVLSVAFMLGWSALMGRCSPQRPAPKPATPLTNGAPVNPEAPGVVPAQPGNPVQPGNPAPPPGPEKPKPLQSAPHSEWTVELKDSEWLDVGVTTRGGAVRFVRLKNSYEESERDNPKREPFDVLVPGYPDFLTGDTTLDDADTEQMRTLDWTVESKTPEAVSFSFLTAGGLKITKTLTWPTGERRFDLDLAVKAERVSGAAPAGSEKGETVSIRVLAAGLSAESATFTSMTSPTQVVRRILGVDDSDPTMDNWSLGRYEISPADIDARPFRFVGITSHFFTTLLWSDADAGRPRVKRVWAEGGDANKRDWKAAYEELRRVFEARGRNFDADTLLRKRMESSALNFHRAWVELDVPVGSAGKSAAPSVIHVYAGPLARTAFAEDRYRELSPLITYPMAPDFVARFLLSVFDIAKQLTGSAGLAVILMTIFVRGGMMPLSIKNQLSMRRQGRKMAKLKPKLEQIKAKFGKDPIRLRTETAKLYKEHGIGFPMGCIMLLLQIPIFMSLFASLRIEFAVRQEPFLWISDLAGTDRIIDFHRELFGVIPGGVRGINLLPLLYMGLSIIQQRLMPKALDEQQAQQMKMAKWMSIIFPILLYNYTAALALYMVVSSTIAIFESRIVRAKDQHDIAKSMAPAA